jgi:predicted enzyme related to lactoylglutathione lyase
MATERTPANWFEIPVKDLDRAKGFYEYVLGVQLAVGDLGPLQMVWFPMIQNAPGAAGALVKAEGYKPSTAGTLVYFSVGDIEATLARVKNKAGKVLTPKTSIGQYGFIAHFRDCEGNRVGLHSMA